MINHHAILKDQLRRIGNNINKKYVILRKQVIKTSQVFETNNIPIFPYEVCFGLFKALADTGSVHSLLAFLPFFQQIINLGFANIDMSRQILNLLNQLKLLPKFQGHQNQLKIQQILILLISKTTISLQSLNFSHSLFNMFCSLQNYKYKDLWMKSSTALCQIVCLCINSLQDTQNNKNYLLLKQFLLDLIKLISGQKQKPKWFIQTIDPFLIYSIFYQILQNKFIITNQNQWENVFLKIIPSTRKSIIKICQTYHPTSLTHIKNWQLSSQQKMILLLGINSKFTKLFKNGFQILEEIIRLITQKSNFQWKVLAYQTVNYLFNQNQWMSSLLGSNYADLFNFLLTTQFNILKSVVNQYKDKMNLQNTQQQFPKIHSNHQLQFNPTQFAPGRQIKLIIKNLQEITYCLYSIYINFLKEKGQKTIQEEPALYKTYKFCQKTIFEMIKAVFPRDMSEQTLQAILKIAQKFIDISGSLKDYTVSTMFIKLVCKYCLPTDFRLIGYRHVQINKMILNTVNCLGNLLNTACWVIVWKALENYSLYYNKYLLSKQHYQPERKTDVEILYKSMDSIFTQSAKYNDQYLLNILDSLVQVTYQCLENNYSDDAKKIFSFERIQQIYKLNLYRIPLMWPSLSSSLLCITTSKVPYFRISALNLLNSLIPISLQSLHHHPQYLSLTFNKDNYEILIFEPWMNLVKCQFQQLRHQLVLALNKIIIDYGHILTHGWLSILHVVSQMSDLKSLQAIVQTFLDKVDNHIMKILIIVDSIQRNLVDTNQKYLCLTLIWAIGDHAHKHNHPQVLRKIYVILLQPDQMFNLGTQARHSSFYIFAELIVHNCLENSPQFWEQVFKQIQIFCSYGVNRSLQSKDKKLAQQAIKNILTNLIKIYRIFFMVSQQWKQKILINNKLRYFYELCSKILKFRQSQIYQALLKQMKQILFVKINQSLQLQQLIIFLEAITQAYYVDPDNKILKCLITYLPSDIYQILIKCIPISSHHFSVLYKLIQKIFLLRLQAEQKDVKLAQARIFFQDKLFNQFWKKFHLNLISQYPQTVGQYIQQVVKTLHRLILYQDYNYLSKMFQYATSILMKFHEIPQEGFLQLLGKVMKLKYDKNWLHKYGNTKQVPIWYIATQQLIKISYQLLYREKQSCVKKTYNILFRILADKPIDLQIKQICSIESISFYYENQMTIISFLIDNFFYNTNQLSVELNNQDLNIILSGLIKETQKYDEKNPKSWSKSSYQLLFKISNRIQIQYSNLLMQRQAIVIQYLLIRVIQSFNSFFKSEGSTQESYIQNQIKFVLKKLSTLELEPDILQKIKVNHINNENKQINMNSKVLTISKAHLFYLNEFLSKCIKSKDQQIRNIISDIFSVLGATLLNIQ